MPREGLGRNYIQWLTIAISSDAVTHVQRPQHSNSLPQRVAQSIESSNKVSSMWIFPPVVEQTESYFRTDPMSDLYSSIKQDGCAPQETPATNFNKFSGGIFAAHILHDSSIATQHRNIYPNIWYVSSEVAHMIRFLPVLVVVRVF
jgi:hypothetical protein